MNFNQALYILYPEIVETKNDIAYNANNEVVSYNVAVVQAHVDSFTYQTNRKYPSIADQLDMLWHAMNNNEIPRANTFYTAIQTVKNAHPKS